MKPQQEHEFIPVGQTDHSKVCAQCGQPKDHISHLYAAMAAQIRKVPCGLVYPSDVSTQLCGICGFPEWQHRRTGQSDARKHATLLPESPDTAMARRAIKRAIETLKWALDDLG